MEKINFSSTSFKGFSPNEDILVDTGVLLAYVNEYDSWSTVVTELFNKYILNEETDDVVFLYINPCILNEVMHLTSERKSISSYLKAHISETLTSDEIEAIENKTVDAIRVMIEKDVLIPLEAGKETYLRQLNTYKELGSADSFNASLANDFGISLLTVDNKLVNNILTNLSNFPTLDKVYYAPPSKRSYK